MALIQFMALHDDERTGSGQYVFRAGLVAASCQIKRVLDKGVQGIDAPEITQAFGHLARQQLTHFILNKVVGIDPTRKINYGQRRESFSHQPYYCWAFQVYPIIITGRRTRLIRWTKLQFHNRMDLPILDSL
jgi:hypothetical protein